MWDCLFYESILDIIVYFTNQFIVCIKENFLQERGENYIDKTELKGLSVLNDSGFYLEYLRFKDLKKN